ncbi:glycogen/starch/alpha-glucan phosphorylase [Myxococcus sp. AM009]|uniref:glycogen/starch/alpha-glucan phosphorylase n=1 Tax=unclassified Myxococcus TaxID=2648731 RepID=UPI001595274F|nr:MULTISPECIES: glycogen/starch/alpha-glucan phosphorylase [unclassified Myxococcus]NVJ00606.1 glycogen/starch/alpha-glucan phosphorylase [Myxococcus sp. AM009]NVJ14629.1 glycogen/starch/alpha-glucan phosphorylase [Myxococcus sp. AM010]
MAPPASASQQPRPAQPAQTDDSGRVGHDAASLRRSFLDHVRYSRGKNYESSTPHDRFMALSLAVRDRLADRWVKTSRTYYEKDVKRAYYLSAEYLLGRALGNNLLNLGMYEAAAESMQEVGVDLTNLLEMEPDAGLGNGGLGRLAACFMESLATLAYPGMGYGIRYEFGIFTQDIVDGYQVERADEWLKFGNPWEIVRPEKAVPVRFFGRVEHHQGPDGRPVARWVGGKTVVGVPYDTPIAGYHNNTVNTLRLWQARASEEFDLLLFNAGDYERSVVEKNDSEVISKVLYPNDAFQAGKELRLKQQYFFVACSIADIVRRYLKNHTDFRDFSRKAAIQLNDTHPAIGVAELMRVLVDERRLLWDEAWTITQETFGYTNHTLLAEAMERWPATLFERLLPRHLEIIYEINTRFLRQVQIRYPYDQEKMQRMSLVEEGAEKKIRMAHLAVVGSHSVNGVAALHTDLLRRDVLTDFAAMNPERFNNKTNGVTPRRWLAWCNPRLSKLITSRIGEGWATDLDKLTKLEAHAEDPEFRKAFRDVKRANKEDLARHIRDLRWVQLNPDAIFDVQIKRLHEYKRQLLNALHIVALWMKARRDPSTIIHPRAFIFGAKAAPGYHLAKLTIRLINGIAEVVNSDAGTTGLQVVFAPNYRVSLAERIIPAADVSEQISTAGMEASGTGNMKLMLNGALTLGTLDGANVEIRDAVGDENFFLFGLTADEVIARKREGYRPRDVYSQHQELREALDLISTGFFSPEDKHLFKPLVDSLLEEDRYLMLADFPSYMAKQEEVAQAYKDADGWARKCIINVARGGIFSSDRTIKQYAEEIWRIQQTPVEP